MLRSSSRPLELTEKDKEMTRKDYVLIAESIKGAINYEKEFNNNKAGEDVMKKFSVALALTLQADNPRFDRARFLTACGVN